MECDNSQHVHAPQRLDARDLDPATNAFTRRAHAIDLSFAANNLHYSGDGTLFASRHPLFHSLRASRVTSLYQLGTMLDSPRILSWPEAERGFAQITSYR